MARNTGWYWFGVLQPYLFPNKMPKVQKVDASVHWELIVHLILMNCFLWIPYRKFPFRKMIAWLWNGPTKRINFNFWSFYFSFNFNAFCFVCEMFILMGYWWATKKSGILLLKGGPNSEISHIAFLFFIQFWCSFLSLNWLYWEPRNQLFR